MYKNLLLACGFLGLSSQVDGSAAAVKPYPLTRQPHKKKISQIDFDRLSKTLGAETARLFVANATKSDKEKQEAEKTVELVFTPKNVVGQFGAFKASQKKAHNTKTPGARCCGLSNEE